jgi:hypothetical protein
MRRINWALVALAGVIGTVYGAAVMSMDVPPHMTKPVEWLDVVMAVSCFLGTGLLGWVAHQLHIVE